MKKLVLLAVALVMAGCATVMPEPRMPFPAEEYAKLNRSGSAKVTGQVFLKTAGGDVKFGAGNEVILNPVTSYSDEWYVRAFIGKAWLEDADVRLWSYAQKTISDGSGRFMFRRVPNGEYYVLSKVTWSVHGVNDQGGYLCKKISVVNSEDVDVMVTE